MILASASNARHVLLEKAGIVHKVIVSDIKEEEFQETNVQKLVQELSLAKATSVLKNCLRKDIDSGEAFEEFLVLGCDSLFEFEGTVLGKPRDFEDAINRLKLISSKSGFIHTSHSLLVMSSSLNFESKKAFKCVLKEVITTKFKFT